MSGCTEPVYELVFAFEELAAAICVINVVLCASEASHGDAVVVAALDMLDCVFGAGSS